jgi:hypothetical protein
MVKINKYLNESDVEVYDNYDVTATITWKVDSSSPKKAEQEIKKKLSKLVKQGGVTEYNIKAKKSNYF